MINKAPFPPEGSNSLSNILQNILKPKDHTKIVLTFFGHKWYDWVKRMHGDPLSIPQPQVGEVLCYLLSLGESPSRLPPSQIHGPAEIVAMATSSNPPRNHLRALGAVMKPAVESRWILTRLNGWQRVSILFTCCSSSSSSQKIGAKLTAATKMAATILAIYFW